MTIAHAATFRTATGQRLHIRECPFVLGAVLFEATSEDLATREVCRWCAAELSEEGRTYHDTIEAALLDMGAMRSTIATIAGHLRTVEHDTVYVPFSRAYVSLALEGRSVAWAGKTYVAFREGEPIYLPEYVGTTCEGTSQRIIARGAVCPEHHVERSLTGECWSCQ